eukprot:38944_1
MALVRRLVIGGVGGAGLGFYLRSRGDNSASSGCDDLHRPLVGQRTFQSVLSVAEATVDSGFSRLCEVVKRRSLGFLRSAHAESALTYPEGVSLSDWVGFADTLVPLPPQSRDTITDSIRPFRPYAELRKIISNASGSTQIQRGWVSHVTSCTFNANREIEDTFAVKTHLPYANGLLFGVFDGHGGKAASHFCRDEMFDFLEYIRFSDDDVVTKSGFVLADGCFLARAFNENRINDGLSGACTVVSHVSDGLVTTGNAGDCRAIIARRIKDSYPSRFEAIQLTEDHQIDTNAKERERILREHPNEMNVIHRHRVKGGLQPTRGIGDGKYKRMDYFAQSKSARDQSTWTPPYTTAEPDISKHKLGPDDEFMVLATDGLFQDLSSQEVVDHAADFLSSPKDTDTNLSAYLVEKALLAASEYRYGRIGEENNLNLVLNLKPGPDRRRVHDDVTVLVVFFNSSADHESDAAVGSSVPLEQPQTMKRCLEFGTDSKREKYKTVTW